MDKIKTWEERMSTSGRRESEALAVELMQVEIAEYRALAARATPAQPVPVAWLVEFEYLGGTTKRGPALKVVSEHWGAHRFVTLDKAEACLPDDFAAYEVRNYKKTLLGPIATSSPATDVSAPSPSSVGAAIHYPECWDVAAYPTLESALSEIYAFFKCSNDESANASEAAALAEQVQGQGQQMLEGWKLVPIEPTLEMCQAARKVPEPVKPYPPHFHLIWDAMLAAAPSIAQDGQKSEGGRLKC